MANKNNNGINYKVENGSFLATVTETKNNVQNIERYNDYISTLLEVGRVATLKIVEAVTRVSVMSLWKADVSEKTNLPFTSINEWAIERFGFSKSHVSEMLKVSKMLCDPATGVVLDNFQGYSYTQLLAFTKNIPLLTKVKNGEDVEGLSLALTAKEIANFGIKALSDKGENKDKTEDSKTEDSKTEDSKTDNSKTEDKPSENVSRETTSGTPKYSIDESVLLDWHTALVDVYNGADKSKLNVVLDRLAEILGLPF